MIIVDCEQDFLCWEIDSWLDGAVVFFYSRFGLFLKFEGDVANPGKT